MPSRRCSWPGDEGDGCYRVEEGLLKASVAAPNGGERILAISRTWRRWGDLTGCPASKARVAELIINVEEKVDQLDLAFEGLEDTYAQSTTSEAIAGLAGRLDGVENKLDVLPAVLQKLATVERLEMRLDRVENKLDQLLLALEKIEATPQAVRSTNSTRKSPGPRSGSAKGQAGKAKV